MAGKAPSPFSSAFDGPQFGALRYNTSQAGSPLALVYGTQRVSCNLLEFWGFSGPSHPPGSKGGKGFGSSSGKKGGGTYSVYVAFAICQGPVSFTGAQNGIGGNNRIFSNGGIAAGLSNVGLNGYSGDDGQAADPVFASQDPNQPVIGYSGTAYVTGTPMQLGSSPVLPDIQFEITGFFSGTTGTTYPDDARPDYMIVDFLTNPRYGAGFPAALLDNGGLDIGAYVGHEAGSFNDFGIYCQAALLGMSLVMDRQQAASAWLREIAQLANAAVVWTGTVLKLIPYGDQAISQNGANWSPNLSYVAEIGDSDLLPFEHASSDGKPVENASDPVQYAFSDAQAIPNWVPVEYQDSINSYNQQISPTFDQGQIDQFGLRLKASIVAHAITNAVSAGISGFLTLERAIQIRTKPKFKLGWKWAVLEPMDIVLLTDAGAGFTQQPFRITGYSEDDNGDLTFDAEEFPGIIVGAAVIGYGSATANGGAGYPRSNSGGPAPNYQKMPSPVAAPFIFEPTAGQLLANGDSTPLLVIGLSAGPTGYDPNWGGADIYVSADNATYALFGTFRAPDSTMGTLTAALPAFSGANPDTADTLAVNIAGSNAELQSFSAALASSLVSMCAVQATNGGPYELLAYETATLTATGQYSLTTLYRGLYCTTGLAHASGDQFLFLEDGNYFYHTLPPQWIGKTLYFKFTSFNRFGAAEQDLSAAYAFTYVPTGGGYGQGTSGVPTVPTGLAASPLTAAVALSWTANNSCDNVTDYLVFRAAGLSQAFSAATKIATIAGTQYLDSGLVAGSSWTYFIEAENVVGASAASAGVNATVPASASVLDTTVIRVTSGASYTLSSLSTTETLVVIESTATAGSFALSIPPAASWGGHKLFLKVQPGFLGAVTVTPSAGTVELAASETIYPSDDLALFANGGASNWEVV